MSWRVPPPRAGLAFLLVFVLLSAGIVTASWFYSRKSAQQYRAEAERQLSAIAESKVREIVNWREERLSDAQSVMQNPLLAEPVQRFLLGPADAASTARLTQWLQSLQEHNQALRASTRLCNRCLLAVALASSGNQER